MRGFSKKRLLLVGGTVTTIGAAAALLAGATFGFFSSAGVGSGSSTFTGGRVVVGLGAGTTVTCTTGPMSAGDDQTKSGNAACQYDVQYTGNVRAFLALDVAITGTAGTSIEIPYTQTTAPPPKQGLYDGTITGLQLDIHDGSAVSYVSGVHYNDQAASSQVLTPIAGAASITDLLVTGSPITSATAPTHVTVNFSLPSGAGNGYNGATSTITLRIHAVQADNNPITSGCVAGNVCATGMAWS
jgi:hypothetical protein